MRMCCRAGRAAKKSGHASFGENPQKILRIETIANFSRAIAERFFETLDRISSAFGVRIVSRKKVQLRIRLIDQRADILEYVRRESHLLRELLGRRARKA